MNKLLTAILIVLIWGGCANRVPPTGGPKDELPPTLIGSIPKNGNVNVKLNEITLLFDELVVTKNIKKELLITPRIGFDYDYQIKNNTIILTLEEPLDSATTYTFNFRNSIVDITEANPADNLVLAFSTGSILDTLQLAGNINDLFTQKPVENLVVGLYKANDSLNLFNSPPYYLAQTDKKGNYLFRNLKPAEYILNAFADGNNNLICESDREAYAFTNSSINLDTTLIADTLKLQTLNIDTLELKRARSSGQYFTAIASKYLTNLTLKATNDSTIWYTLDKTHKDIKIYNTFKIKDSLLVELSMVDSVNSHVTDTFYLKFSASERKYDEYKIAQSELKVFAESKKISFTINTSKPSHLVSADSILITLDTLAQIPFDSTWNIDINTNSTEFKFSNTLPQTYLDSITTTTSTKTKGSKGKLELKGGKEMKDNKTLEGKKENKKQAKPPSNYSLTIPFASFISIENDSSKLIENTLKPSYNKDFGILMGTITTKHTHYFIQLLNPKFELITEIPQADKYKITHIKPGEYIIRIVLDSNKNGIWDAGNILLNELPEPIFIYKNKDGISKTTIRANWEISLDLDF